jgi:hypothetical protein
MTATLWRWPMDRKLPFALLLALGVGLAGIAHAEEKATQRKFTLTTITGVEAATLLRTIAEVREISSIEDHAIVAGGSPETVALAGDVIKLVESPTTTADDRLPTDNGWVVVKVPLEHVSSRDVMMALRTELKIARLVTLDDKTIVLRDTDAQISSALELIEKMEKEKSSAG